MNVIGFIRQLEVFPSVLSSLLTGLSREELLWRPQETDWSILEIVCHLLDEEIQDFRTRVRMTLLSPDESWPSIDPVQTAVDRQYRAQEFAATLSGFTTERRSSVAWLRHLEHPDWAQAYQHPTLGEIPAGDLLSAWVAHDLLHLKQITRRLYQRTVEEAAPYSTRYAGEWHA